MKFVPLLLAAAFTLTAAAQDWPRYLGPEGKGQVAGALRTNWKEKKPATAWTAKIGRGCSGFAIVGDKALTLGNKGDQDTVWCFEATTGKVLWKHRYAEKLAPKYYDGGPNCTPTIDGDRVYTLSKSGKLFCLALADGSVLWKKDYKKDFGGVMPTWGFGAAPIVRGEELFTVPCSKKGALYVLNKATGKLRWKSSDATKAGYSAPVFLSYKGKDAIAIFHGRELVIYDLKAKGKPLFQHKWRTSYEVNASNPQYQDGKMFLASGYGMGYAVLDVSKGPKAKVLHQDHDVRMIFQNSILLEGDIVGVFGDKNIDAELMRMDLATGKVRWKLALPGTRGSSLMVGDTLVALSETGTLVCGKVTKDKFTELGRTDILGKLCWAPVAFANGHLYARTNKGEAICLDVRK